MSKGLALLQCVAAEVLERYLSCGGLPLRSMNPKLQARLPSAGAPKKPKALIQRNSHICTPMFIAELFTIAKNGEQPKCRSVDKWIKCCGTFTQWNTTQL